jgi:prophage tail gpP-like protein
VLAEDAFAIPADYAWINSEEKRRRDREKKHKRAKKGKSKASSSDRKP